MTVVNLPNGDTANFPDEMSPDEIKSILNKKFNVKNENLNENNNASFKDTLMGMIKSKLNAYNTPGTRAEVFKRSLERSALKGGLNAVEFPIDVINKFQGKPALNLSQYIPQSIQKNQFDEQHPIAEGAGNLAGFALPGGLAFKGVEALPLAGKLLEAGESGILGRILKNSIKGGITGGVLSNPSERFQGAALGGLLGAPLAEIPGIARTVKNAYERTKNVSNLSSLQKEAQKAAQGDVEAQQNLEEYHQEAKNQENKAKESLQSYLGQEETHGVPLAAEINKAHAQNVENAKQLYNNLDKNLSDKKVVISNPRDASSIYKEIGQIIKETKNYDSPEIQKLTKEWEDAKKGDSQTMTAKDLLTQYRTARDIAGETWKETSNPLLKEDERLSLREKAKMLDEKTDKIKEMLDTHMDDEDKKIMEQANTIYRDKIKPLEKNDVFYQANKQGNVTAKVINKLAGPENEQEAGSPLTSEMKAKKVLRDIIKENPEANRLALGQLFSSNPEKIHIPNNEASSYIEKSPEIKELKQQHADAMEETEKAKNALDLSKSNRKRIEVGLEPNLTEEKAVSEVNRLSKLAKEANISLKEKIKREKELEIAKKDLKRIKTIGTLGAGLAIGATTTPSILKKLGVY